jgi:serine/threonine protein kinase
MGDRLPRVIACQGALLQLRWIEQITASVAFVHSKMVLHRDISCNNVFLDKEHNTKLGDFAGSSIDGKAPFICYKTSHKHPEIDGISKRSEMFALSSTFYEIMAGSRPYKELSDPEICNAYTQGKYPSLASLAAFNDIIARCWTQGYASVDELLEDVKAEGMLSNC